MIKRIVYTFALLLMVQSVVAEAPRLDVRFEPDSVGIGDLVQLFVDVEQDVMDIIAYPEFEVGGESLLEMVGKPRLDTLEAEGRRLKLRRSYTFRSFDEGYYNMGRVAVLHVDKSGSDTLYSRDSIRLMVGTFLIDSTSHSIFDLKPVRNLPFQFGEISDYMMWGVVALILLAVALYVFAKVMAHLGRPVMGLFKPEPPLPPHIAAFAALDELKSENLWQGGEYKGYYSRLSDILRTYLSGRYGVTAMEMTSDEIIAAVRVLDLPTQCEMELRDFLRDADLVKFAKAEFSGSQNERYFESARLFVEMTKEVEEIEDGEETTKE